MKSRRSSIQQYIGLHDTMYAMQDNMLKT